MGVLVVLFQSAIMAGFALFAGSRFALRPGALMLMYVLGNFAAAAALADSALGWNAGVPVSDSIQSEVRDLQTGFLALTGQVRRAVALDLEEAGESTILLPSGEIRKLNADLGADGKRLDTYAAFGLPRDSIIAVSDRIWANVESMVRASEVNAFRTAILKRPLSLVVNVVGTGPLARLGPSSDLFANAVLALEKGDRRGAARYADSLETIRAGSAPGEVTMDAVLQDAWLRYALGDTVKATRILDRALGGLARAPQNLVKDAIIPAALVRVMLFRADLAEASGDATVAQRWRSAATALWGHGDPEVRSTLAGSRAAR
jgi:hypothetical protein